MTAPTFVIVRDREFRLGPGTHATPTDGACVMEVVSFLADEPWSDHPACASPVIAGFCRALWDGNRDAWPGLLVRAKLIAGSATTAEIDMARAYLATDWAVRRIAPQWLRRIGFDDDAESLEALGPITDAASALAVPYTGIGERAWAHFEGLGGDWSDHLNRPQTSLVVAVEAAIGESEAEGTSAALDAAGMYEASVTPGDEGLATEDGFAMLDAMLALGAAA